jgi:hypothetical protein
VIKSFEHQTPPSAAHWPHPEPKAQHGQKPDDACLKLPEKRSFQPRPGH